MLTREQLRREADLVGAAAPRETDYDSVADGIWPGEYRDYDARSDDAALRYPHEFDLRYGPDPRQMLDIWLPRTPVRDAPVFVFFHGGALADGHPRQYGFLAPPFLDRGAIFVCPSYRLMDPEIVAERRALEKESDVFVHQLTAGADEKYERTRRAGVDAARRAADDARAAVVWVARHIAAFGGRPDNLVIGGHSAGAMLCVATACSSEWQEPAGLPVGVVSGMMPISGRYGMFLGNAIISHGDLDFPKRDWSIPYAPTGTAVVFGELESDGEGKDVPERMADCAVIGRGLVTALTEMGADARQVALPPLNHSESVRSLGDVGSPTFRAALGLLGLVQ